MAGALRTSCEPCDFVRASHRRMQASFVGPLPTTLTWTTREPNTCSALTAWEPHTCSDRVGTKHRHKADSIRRPPQSRAVTMNFRAQLSGNSVSCQKQLPTLSMPGATQHSRWARSCMLEAAHGGRLPVAGRVYPLQALQFGGPPPGRRPAQSREVRMRPVATRKQQKQGADSRVDTIAQLLHRSGCQGRSSYSA
eukprot:366111-Chlamydomonas_euryale.AAC.23